MPGTTVISNSRTMPLRSNVFMGLTSVMQDHVDDGGDLGALVTLVVGRDVIGMVVAQFRTDLQVLRYPMRHTQRVAGIARGEAGALAFLVVVPLVAERHHVVAVQLEVQVVDDAVLAGLARFRRGSDHARLATRTEARD